MSSVNKIIGVVLIMTLGLLVLAIFLPSKQRSFATLRIDTSLNSAYQEVVNTKKWNSWNAFICSNVKLYVKDSVLKLDNLEGDISSVQIVKCINNSILNTKINIGNRHVLNGSWKFREEEGFVRVTWIIETDNLSYPSGKIMGLFFGPFIHSIQAKSLENIKENLIK
jgi:hypothetical protein